MTSHDVIRKRWSEHWYEQGLYTSRTFGDEFRAGVEEHPDARLIFDSETRPAVITIKEIHERGTRIADGLQKLGLRRGDAIACQVPNWVESALIYHAALTLGLVVVPVVHIYGPTEVGFIVRQSRARALVIPDRWRRIDFLERLGDLGDTPDLENVIVIGDEAPEGALTFEQLEALGQGQPTLEPLSPDDVCMVVYTSGTTSDPKGVQHTHNTLLSEIRSQLDRRPDADATKFTPFSPFPAGHMGGVLAIARAFLAGNTSIFLDAWSAERGAVLLRDYDVTFMGSTPYFLQTLIDEVHLQGIQLPHLYEIHLGGAGVPPSIVEAADREGWRAFRSYGSTEHATVSGALPSAPLTMRAMTDGPPYGASMIRVVNESGQDAEIDAEGEVLTMGPELFVGYTVPELNEEAFDGDGWFRTGDIGRIDANGCVTIVDRMKDIVIRGGENISSLEVEAILSRHPAVMEAAVVSMPDPLYGERACAFVILRAGTQLSLKDVQEHFVAMGVAKQKTPERIEIVDDFPRTAAGKLKKVELRNRLRTELDIC